MRVNLRSRAWAAFTLLIALQCLGGCAAFVTKGEYRAYRAVRTASHQATRLNRMRVYLREFPAGTWAEDFRAARRAAEPGFFEMAGNQPAGLRAYLAAFPDGTFAAQARSRLAASEVLVEKQAQDAAEERAQAALAEQRRAELQRTWVSRFLQYWLHVFTGIQGWGQPIAHMAEANPDFSAAFGRPPRPRCSAHDCVKYYTGHYTVPLAGATGLQRTLQLVVRLQLKSGRVVGAELLLPGWGFSRWQEAEQRKLVDDRSVAQRRGATGWARAQIEEGLAQTGGRVQFLGEERYPGFDGPVLGPTGAVIDTASEDPAAVLLAADTAEQAEAVIPLTPAGVGPAAVVQEPAELTDPAIPEITLAPVSVARDQRGLASGTDLGPQAEITALQRPEVVQPGAAVAAQARRYRIGNLEVLWFAASGDASAPAYDGLRIRRLGTGRPHP